MTRQLPDSSSYRSGATSLIQQKGVGVVQNASAVYRHLPSDRWACHRAASRCTLAQVGGSDEACSSIEKDWTDHDNRLSITGVCVLQSNEAPKGRMRPVPANQRGNKLKRATGITRIHLDCLCMCVKQSRSTPSRAPRLTTTRELAMNLVLSWHLFIICCAPQPLTDWPAAGARRRRDRARGSPQSRRGSRPRRTTQTACRGRLSHRQGRNARAHRRGKGRCRARGLQGEGNRREITHVESRPTNHKQLMPELAVLENDPHTGWASFGCRSHRNCQGWCPIVSSRSFWRPIEVGYTPDQTRPQSRMEYLGRYKQGDGTR